MLALELYLRLGVVGLGGCQSLSEELRSLPIERHLASDPSFRNAQSVRSKLYNLQWLETDGARGRPNAGAQTVAVWERFGGDQSHVEAEAVEIRRALADAADHDGASTDDDYEVDESAVRFVAHRRRERDQGLVLRKRRQVLRRMGALACEACGFDSHAEWNVEGSLSVTTSRP